MEDRYLFKAKRVDNGEWVTGQYVKGLDMYGKEVHLIFEPTTIFYSSSETDGWSEIDPSTICQCAGLKDKNGKLICENDIVKFDVYYYENLESSIISQIMWCNDLCALSLVVNDIGTRGTLGHLMDLNKEIEVIGNIFDNPELLESEE